MPGKSVEDLLKTIPIGNSDTGNGGYNLRKGGPCGPQCPVCEALRRAPQRKQKMR